MHRYGRASRKAAAINDQGRRPSADFFLQHLVKQISARPPRPSRASGPAEEVRAIHRPRCAPRFPRTDREKGPRGAAISSARKCAATKPYTGNIADLRGSMPHRAMTSGGQVADNTSLGWNSVETKEEPSRPTLSALAGTTGGIQD